MSDTKRERIAKQLLSLFLEIWCDRESEREPWFNCSKCELKMFDGTCLVKTFLNTQKYETGCPQGMIEEVEA